MILMRLFTYLLLVSPEAKYGILVAFFSQRSTDLFDVVIDEGGGIILGKIDILI